MKAPVQVLASYVPAMVLDHLAAEEAAGSRGATRRFQAALLLADVTGSMALAERLSRRGRGGAGRFGRILNAYFSILIEVITAHGGDLVKFAGDGLLALWPAGEGEGAPELAARRAAQCALEVQRAVRDYVAEGEVEISLRIGVSVGEVSALHADADYHRSELVLDGPALIETIRAEPQAQPGRVVAAQQAWPLLRPSFAGTVLDSGATLLESVLDPIPAQPLEARDPMQVSEDELRAYVPQAVRLRATDAEDEWLAELRRVTTLFIRLPRFATDRPGQVQTDLRLVNASVSRYKGMLARVSVDEKGPVVLAAFGLPPQAHEDDAVRAVRTALEIEAALREQGECTYVGITTGRVFCGPVGNDRRREYTMVGNAANLAARLMQTVDDGILCDSATREAAEGHVNFHELKPVTIKSVASRVDVWRPHGISTGSRSMSARAHRKQTSLVGREEHRKALRDGIDRLVGSGGSAAFLIEGEAGIGKSRLIGDLADYSARSEVRALVGGGDAIEATTPYHAWRPVFTDLFGGGESIEDLSNERARVSDLLKQWLAGDEESVPPLERAPLLNSVLPLDFPTNDWTSGMSAEARSDNTRQLLVRLLEIAAAAGPLLLVLEDAHWLDSASWALASLVSQRVSPLLLVVTSRPPNEQEHPEHSEHLEPHEFDQPEYRKLEQAAGTSKIVLDTLSAEDARAQICDCLGVSRLADSVADFIQERAHGHPFFTEELAFALRDQKVLEMSAGDECRLRGDARDLAELRLPANVEGVITSRIDRLNLRHRIALKVASVLGRTFTLSALRDVHPVRASIADLVSDLAELERLGLIAEDSSAPEATYAFKHAITREVAYDGMPDERKQRLHKVVAERLEKIHEADISPVYPLLAHHWCGALDPHGPQAPIMAKAIDTLELAGKQAAANYANRESVSFFDEALRIQELQNGDTASAEDSRRRARWELILGAANYRLGKPEDARHHLDEALTLMGNAIPSNPLRLALGLASEAGRQAANRLLPSLGRRDASADDRAAALEAAGACELLGFVMLLMRPQLAALLAALRAINLAETAGPSPELATSSAVFGMAGGAYMGRRVAERYFEIGRAAAAEVNDIYGLGRVSMMRGFYLIGQGDWAGAEQSLAQGRTAFREIGDERWVESCTLHIGNLHYIHRRFSEGMSCYEEALDASRRRGDTQSETWSYVGIAAAHVVIGDGERALTALDAIDTLLAGDLSRLGDRASAFGVVCIRALANLRCGRPEAALEVAEEAARNLGRPMFLYHAMPGYVHFAEVGVRLWEWAQVSGSAGASGTKALAARGVRTLKDFARRCPVAKPQALVWSGLHSWLRGKHGKARKIWTEARELAAAMDMPYEEGLALLELGRHASRGDHARTEHLERARAIFLELGANYDAACAQAALESEEGPALALPSGSPVG